MLIWILLLVVGAVLGAAITLFSCRARRGPAFPRDSGQAWRTVAVLLMNGVLPRSALSVAARLSRATCGQVVLLAIAPVPRTMRIESEAAPGLEAALRQIEEAECVLRRLGAEAHGEIVRVREATDIVRRTCQEIGAEVLVIEPNALSRGTDELIRALTDPKRPRGFDLVVTSRSTPIQSADLTSSLGSRPEGSTVAPCETNPAGSVAPPGARGGARSGDWQPSQWRLW